MRKAISRLAASSPAVDKPPPPASVEWDRESGLKLGAVLTTGDRRVIFDQVRESSVAYHLGMREGMQLLSIGDELLHDASRAHEILGNHKEGTLQFQYTHVC